MKTLRSSVPRPSLDEGTPASNPLHRASGSDMPPKDERKLPLKSCRPGEAETIKRYLALLEEMECEKGLQNLRAKAVARGEKADRLKS